MFIYNIFFRQSNELIEKPLVEEVLEGACSPVAKKIRVKHEVHGEVRNDDYHWLKDKKDPDVIPYLNEWNSYTDEKIKPLQQLTDKLEQEFISRLTPNYISLPHNIGPFDYYVRLEEGKDHPIFCRKAVDGGKEQIVLDGNIYSEGKKYFSVMEMEPSPNGKFVIFTIDHDGSQFGKIHIKDMDKGEFIEDEVINGSDGKVVWNTSSTGIWYTQVNAKLRTDKVCIHNVGEDPKFDKVITKEDSPLFDLSISNDKLKRYIIITSQSSDSSEVSIGSLDNPNETFRVVRPKDKNVIYSLIPGDQTHYILFSEKKKNWALAKIEECNLSKTHWEEVISPDKEFEILDVAVFKDYLALSKRINGLTKIEILSLKDQSTHTIPFPEDICDVDFRINDKYDTVELRLDYTSPITPKTIFSYNMETRKLETLKKTSAANFDSSLYTTKRIWAKADDGAEIPITLYHKKGLSQDSTTPLYLYAYGAYGMTCYSTFENNIASLLERGVYCAIAHIRGGGYLGRQWYNQGAMKSKINSFTDFINCAEHLIAQKYTAPKKLAIEGRSAGGLLMGGVINMRPDLFKACIAGVPFVDVTTTMFDETLPLTTQEWVEWGNPNKKEEYDSIMEYSPYDNVEEKEYPSLFVTAGYNDQQVQYHEPAKWVSKIAECKTDKNPLLFKTNMGAGHHGASGRYKAQKEDAPLFAFLLHELGIDN